MKNIIIRCIIIPLAFMATLLIGWDVAKIVISQFYLADFHYLDKKISSPTKQSPSKELNLEQALNTNEAKVTEAELQELFSDLEKAIKFQPMNAEPYALAGNKYLTMFKDQLRDSILFVEKEGRLLPRPSFEAKALIDKSLFYLLQAAKRNPIDSFIWLQLGWAAGLSLNVIETEQVTGVTNDMIEGWKKDIDKIFLAAQRLRPTDSFIFYSSGVYYLSQGDFSFINLFRRVSELKKSEGLTELLELVWSDPQMGQDFSLLEQVSLEEFTAYSQLAKFALNRNLIPEAIRTLKKLEVLRKEAADKLVAEAKSLKGKTKIEAEKNPKVKELFTRAVQLDPWNFEALEALGRFQDILKRKALLDESSLSGVNASTNDTKVLSKAEQIYLKAIKENPDSFEAWLGLKKVTGMKGLSNQAENLQIQKEVESRATEKVDKMSWSHTKWGPGNLYNNGSVWAQLHLLGGEYMVKMELKGTPAVSIYPLALIRLDDRLLEIIYVEAPQGKTYSIPISIKSGTHTLSVELMNEGNYTFLNEERALQVEGLTIGRLGADGKKNEEAKESKKIKK